MTKIKFRYYTLAVRFMLILLFFYAATSKAAIFPEFLNQLTESPIIPSYLTFFIGIIIIASELIICVLLFSEKYSYWGLLFSYSLMLFFTLYLFYLVKMASTVPCACGGILGNLSHSQHLLFNLIILVTIIPTLSKSRIFLKTDI